MTILLWHSMLVIGSFSSMVLLIISIHRWPLIALVSFGATALTAWEFPQLPALLNVIGISIYPTDILCVALFVIALMRWKKVQILLGSVFWFWILFGVLLVVGLLSGFIANGFGLAFNEFRAFFYPFVTFSWVLAEGKRLFSEDEAIRRFSMFLGWGLVALALFHMSTYGLGDTSEFVQTSTTLAQTTRPLVSGQAFMLVMAAFVLSQIGGGNHLYFRWFSVATFFMVVILSQQRTVWAVLLICIVCILLIANSHLRLSLIVAAIVVGWLGLVVYLISVLSGVFVEVAQNSGDTGTYDARVTSWTALVAKSFEEGTQVVLFGAPMGSGFGRFEGAGRWVEFAPHNWYLTIYLRTGIIGFLCIISFCFVLLARLVRHRNAPTLAIVVMAMIVYGWSYSWLWYFAIFFGWSIVRSSHLQADSIASKYMSSSRCMKATSAIDLPMMDQYGEELGKARGPIREHP